MRGTAPRNFFFIRHLSQGNSKTARSWPALNTFGELQIPFSPRPGSSFQLSKLRSEEIQLQRADCSDAYKDLGFCQPHTAVVDVDYVVQWRPQPEFVGSHTATVTYGSKDGIAYIGFG